MLEAPGRCVAAEQRKSAALDKTVVVMFGWTPRHGSSSSGVVQQPGLLKFTGSVTVFPFLPM